MAFAEVYAKSTGRKMRVPEHWLEHPVLGQNIRKTPLSEKQQRQADARIAKAEATTEAPAAGDDTKE